jgi:branched-chain amino acid transport system substrate-binding protein
MKSKLLIVLMVLALLVAACSQATPTVEESASATEAPIVTEEAAPPTEEPVMTEEATEPAATEEPVASEPIKIGYYGPLTGPVAKAGRALMQGAQLKFEEVNQAGGLLGRQIEYITCDDKSTPEEAVKCVQRLITQDNVVANVGSLHSPHLMATGPILDEYKVPTVAAGTSPTWCQEGFQYLWRSTANAAQATDALAAALQDTGIQTIAVLYQNDDYGISGKDALLTSMDYAKPVAEEAYNLGDKDWGGQIISMMAADPDVMAAWSLGEDLGPIFNQMREQGWEGPIIGAEGATYPAIPEIAGENSNGVVFAQLYYIPDKPEDYPDPTIAEYLQKYLDRYGEMPADDNAYRGYDAATVLVTAIENAGSTDPEAVKDAINSISDLQGLAGTFDYAEGGCEGILTSRVWEWENLKIVPYNGIEEYLNQ